MNDVTMNPLREEETSKRKEIAIYTIIYKQFW